jgi:hypothetical protein
MTLYLDDHRKGGDCVSVYGRWTSPEHRTTLASTARGPVEGPVLRDAGDDTLPNRDVREAR